MPLGRAVAIGLALATLTGCGFLGSADPQGPVSYPAGCGAFDLSPRRCQFIVGSLAREADVDLGLVHSIELLGDPGCQENIERLPGEPAVLCMRTVSFVVRVRFTLVDGTVRERDQLCGVGGQYSFRCSERPEIEVNVPTADYFDVPCSGDGVSGCATPLPEPDPETLLAASPVVVPRLDIPIDHLGRHAVALGGGTLANGLLRTSTLTLEDPMPTDVLLGSAVRLEVTPVDPRDPPFSNYYEHGWVDGVQAFSAALTFDVAWFEPGAVISITDIEIS